MTHQRQFLSKIVECPEKHRIKLEILSDTPNMEGAIECPVCGIGMTIFSGDIRGVVPIRQPLFQGHESRLN